MTVVLLPGLNNDAKVWNPTIAALTSQGLTATALDLPALDSLSAIADYVAERLEPGTVLVGHSFGGAVAMEVADRHPDLLKGLVLVNAPTDADDADAAQARRVKAERARDGAHEQMAMAGTEVVFLGERAQDPQVRAERLRGVRAYGAERYYAHNLALIDRPDRTAWTPPHRIPVLVIAAEVDHVVPTAAQRDYAARHELTYREIAQTAHMLPAEEPEQLAREIATWHNTLTERPTHEVTS